MRIGRRMAGGILLAGLLGGVVRTGLAAQDAAASLVGDRLVTLAMNRSRATALSPKAAAEEAEVFLQAARRVDPGNLHTLKLLVEAAGATGDLGVEREALREVIRLDPGDLVAEVKYIDFLASGAETIEERAKIFQGALNAVKLDPQIRSEMALRLANIAQERGDAAGAKALVQQALALNDVNMGALRGGEAGGAEGGGSLGGIGGGGACESVGARGVAGDVADACGGGASRSGGGFFDDGDGAASIGGACTSRGLVPGVGDRPGDGGEAGGGVSDLECDSEVARCAGRGIGGGAAAGE